MNSSGMSIIPNFYQKFPSIDMIGAIKPGTTCISL